MRLHFDEVKSTLSQVLMAHGCARPFLPELKKAAETLPRLANEDAGLMARGILVNLGEMKIKDLHGPEAYKEGLKLNHGRRPMVPLPNN